MKAVFFSVLIILAASCKSSKIYNSRVTNIPATEEGTIYIQSSGLGKNEKKADEQSVYNAFSTLLYQGIPESIQTRPMIEPADADRVKQKVDGCLTDDGCYQRFITQMDRIGGVQKVNKDYAVVNKIKINIRSLRTYLEQNSIIRKFGF